MTGTGEGGFYRDLIGLAVEIFEVVKPWYSAYE
jgi:hypothetical protein